MKITRRQATVLDQDLLYKVKSNALDLNLDDTYEWNEELQRRLHDLHFDPSTITIIELDYDVIGYLQIKDVSKHIRLIENLMILKEYQKMGYGTYIMREEMDKAKQEGIQLKLQALKNNKNALRFYKSLGFEVEKETDTHFVLHFP